MILRDPSERAFSQYLHQLAVGLIRSTFREHLERCMRNDEGKLGVYYPLLEVGLYHRQVKRYLDRFPQNNIRIYWYEEAWGRPDRLLADLFQFLDVDSTFCPDTSRKSLEQKAPRFPTINYAAKRFYITHWLNEAIPSRLRPPIIKFLFRKGRARLSDREKLTAFATSNKVSLKVKPAADAHSRARESLVHVLFNHHEFVTIR